MGILTSRKLIIYTNLLLMLLAPILFLLTVTSAYGSADVVIINEVIYDPEGTDTGYEWIEIKNISGYYINLFNWRIEAGGSKFENVITLENFKMAPNEIRVIGEPNTIADYIVSKLGFQNGGSETDGIRILNDQGIVKDTLLYDSPNINELFDDTGNTGITFAIDVSSGHSLCRISQNDTNNHEEDFIECDDPTPGEENKIQPIAQVEYDDPIYLGKEVVFDGSQSYDPDGTIETYEWKIREPDILEDSQIFKYTFDNEGKFEITFTITDNSGLSTTNVFEIEVVEDPNNPILTSINEARLLDDNTAVSIKGVITASPGLIYEKEGYIQDSTGGIRYKVIEGTKLQNGDVYIFKGKIDTAYGEKRIVVDIITKNEDSLKISPLKIENFKDLVKYIGSLVSITGVVDKKVGSYIYITNSSETAKVNISKYLNIEIPSDIKGKQITATGIISQYGNDEEGNPKLRIMPISSKDITYSNREVLASTGIPISKYLLSIILVFPIAFFYTRKKVNICLS